MQHSQCLKPHAENNPKVWFGRNFAWPAVVIFQFRHQNSSTGPSSIDVSLFPVATFMFLLKDTNDFHEHDLLI
jgi:hypothetical protein